MRRVLLAGLVLSVGWATNVTPAGAVSVTLTQAKPPATYHPSGHAVDVLGIAPGMGADAVRAIIAKQYGDVQVIQDTLGLESNGTSVTTQSFVTRMAAQKGSDQILVWFGTPTTGNGVVEVTRQLSYIGEGDAPELKQTRADLIARYGAPGFDGTAAGTDEILMLAWSFKGNTPTSCAASSCRSDLSEGVDIRGVNSYARAVRTGHELTIVATLLAGITDPNKAASIVVTISDAATKLVSLQTAVSQMRSAGKPAPAAKPDPAKPTTEATPHAGKKGR
jgi:hypothetical protein